MKTKSEAKKKTKNTGGWHTCSRGPQFSRKDFLVRFINLLCLIICDKNGLTAKRQIIKIPVQ